MQNEYIGRIAKNSQVSPKATINHPVDIADNAVVYASCTVDPYTYINVGTIVYSNSHIGSFCSIGRNAQIGLARHPIEFLSTHPFQFSNALFKHVPGYESLQSAKWTFHQRTEIGSDVWIGAGALISSGVKIAHGAVIAAGAVVTADVGAYEIVGGVPAKVIRTRFSGDVIARLLALEWWRWEIESLKGIAFHDISQALNQLELRKANGEVRIRRGK